MNSQVEDADITPMRLAIIGVVIVSLFAALFARLWYLQVMSADALQVQAESNTVRTVYTPAPRGRILDRNGKVLVDNRVVQVVAIEREATKKDPELVARVAAALGKPSSEIQEAVDDPNVSPVRPIPVARDVPKDLIVHLLERPEEFPGVSAEQITERIYPYAGLGAHILGYVGEINDTELHERESAGYRLGDSIGKAGVELSHEDTLRGDPGVTKIEVDRQNRPLRIAEQTTPVPGEDLYLTIDVDLQASTEAALAEGMAAARTQTDGESGKRFAATAGAVVAVSPKTGEVLALASNPTYEPSQFVNGITPEQFQALVSEEAGAPLTNRAVQGLYAPASTFKLFSAVAGIQANMVSAATTIVDEGSYTLKPCEGRCVFKNAGSTRYGPVNMREAITVSSDVYFYDLAYRIWQERDQLGDIIQGNAKSFGFGTRTGIDLGPEAQGRIPDPEVRRQMHEDNPQAFPEGRWFAGDNLIMAIGQGEVVVTPLQLANGYAAFANGGSVWQPHLGLKSVRADGSVAHVFQPNELGRADLSGAARGAVLSGLVGAVNDPSGTAYEAFAGAGLGAFTVAGKTGTAQGYQKQDTALFVGFGPVSDPEIAVAVVIEEGGFGGQVAAPTARAVFQAYLGLAPDGVRVAGSHD